MIVYTSLVKDYSIVCSDITSNHYFEGACSGAWWVQVAVDVRIHYQLTHCVPLDRVTRRQIGYEIVGCISASSQRQACHLTYIHEVTGD